MCAANLRACPALSVPGMSDVLTEPAGSVFVRTTDITAAQSARVEPEVFQERIIINMTDALLAQPSSPCLLRAPTGSGKTFMIARVLEEVGAQKSTLWLWFVPFVNLIQQTEDTLNASCPTLSPNLLNRGRNQDAQAGMVLLSTAQGVARARDRNADYNLDGDDDTRTIHHFIARARAQGLNIGVVVDEAHIGLDKTTEFGKFVRWLTPEFLIMATATPRDERLLAFLAECGKSEYKSFAASRDEVVDARLNKRYIEAVVYDLRQSVQTVADLKTTVLRQAWRRTQRLKKELNAAGVNVVPLMLVQVANGEKTVEEAERDLIKVCGVHPGVIGKHSSNDPDPVMMAAIANDSSKEVLIFKQSAGTGFDAPRAFVLASTKSVNDADFAMQFIGRVMRVARQIREHYPKPTPIPGDFNTAFVYLANAEAQRGFEAAVQATAAVKSQLEGQTEKLIARQTASGAVVYTNRESYQASISADLSFPDALIYGEPPVAQRFPANDSADGQAELFAPADNIPSAPGTDEVDEVVRQVTAARPAAATVRTKADFLDLLSQRGIRAYEINRGAKNLPIALKSERRPEMAGMANVSRAVATRLNISEDLRKNAVRAAMNRLKEIEVHTELTSGERNEQDVWVITDRSALAREAHIALKSIPQVEEEDIRIIVEIISHRLSNSIDEVFEDIDEDVRPSLGERHKLARDAARWVIRREQQTIRELAQKMIAEETEIIDAGPLPDAMLFPAALSLPASRKNIYGVLPPSPEDLARVEQALLLDDRALLIERSVKFEDGNLYVGKYDATLELNGPEREFAEALDRADFVHWWHRNPHSKRYAVQLVRGEHKNYFHPDFLVCLSHVDGDDPMMRLIETKHDIADAIRKAKREPKVYGKVLFLTKDEQRFRIVNPDGTLGDYIDLSDLTVMREKLRESMPVEG